MSENASAPDSDLFLEQLAVGPMQNFVYVIGSRRTREVALIDPAWDIAAIVERVEAQDLRPVAALVTHYHPDHVGGSFMGQQIEGLADLLELRGLKAHVHRDEVHGVKHLTGLSDGDIVKVDSGDTLRLGDVEVEFLHTPGHTPGSLCFRVRERVRDVLVSGDTLFLQGCGRVDLPGSDPDAMYASLRKLAALPDDTVVYPGHQYSAESHETLGAVRRMNPYLTIPSLETWRELMGR